MKRKSLVATLVAGVLTVALAAPAGAWGTSSTRPATIADAVIAKSGTGGPDKNPYDYDLLLKAVLATKLDGALADKAASLTVFAPDDAAFIRTARDLGYTGWSEQGAWNFLASALAGLNGGDPIPVLKNILLYHVVAGRLGAFQVLTSGSLTTLLGSSFQVRLLTLVDKDPQLPNAKLNLFALNQRTGNGVIHGITRVLIPVDLP
jgi:uncharacterized surface protein with fasciclin (FAS1) repeats